MTDWKRTLLAIAPRGKPAILDGMAAAMPACVVRADLATRTRLAHFLAQCAHESDGFATTVEYASGAAYEGRASLGNTAPGDGRRFRGRGVIQLTGRANYREFGAALGAPLEAQPDLAASFPIAALTAAEYWKRRDINRHADLDDIVKTTRDVNGGKNGLKDRQDRLARAKAALARADHATTDLPGALRQRAVEERATAGKTAAAGGVVTGTGAIVATPAAPHAPAWVPWAAGGLGLVFLVAVVVKAIKHAALAKTLDDAAKQGA